MRILFIGGTGNISSACSSLVLGQGHELYLFNRNQTAPRLPEGARLIRGDIRDKTSAAEALKPIRFDVVVDWIAYEPAHVEADIELFRGQTLQYVFISSASAYLIPPEHHVIAESTPLGNPFWQYSRNKIACEERLMREYRENHFPVSIVRPSHTYGESRIPCVVAGHGYTIADRMLKGKPVIVHGDGQSLWTLTHSTDFARGFAGILGRADAVGQSFHITSDETLTWDQIYRTIGMALGVEPMIVHVPSDLINAYDPEAGASLLGDKAYSKVFDNSKIRKFVPQYTAAIPFREGIQKTIAWFDADESRKAVDDQRNRAMDRILEAYGRAWPRTCLSKASFPMR